MSSSRHLSDSRRVRKPSGPEKSNFVQTCNLLSRYIKKKGSLRNLNLEIGGKVESLESIMRPGSSQLTPINIDDASNESSKDAITEPNNAPLTMFYADRVLVFDDYPAKKARELVQLASNIYSNMATGKEKVIPVSGVVASSSVAQEWRPPTPQANNSLEAGVALLNTFNEKMNDGGSSSGAQEWLLQQPRAIGSDKANCVFSNLVKEKVVDGAVASGAQEWLAPDTEVYGSQKASGLFSHPVTERTERTNTGGAATSTPCVQEWLPPLWGTNVSCEDSGVLSDPVKVKLSPGGDVASSSSVRDWLSPQPEDKGSCLAIGTLSSFVEEKTNPVGFVASLPKAQSMIPPQPEANGSDLPIARRSSLHRFLEKRKDRAVARGPYQNQEQPASSSKSDEQLELKL